MLSEQCLVTGLVWRDGEQLLADASVSDAATAARDERNLIWVDVIRPMPRDLRDLARQFGWDDDVLVDAVSTTHVRPKVVRRAGHMVFTAYTTRMRAAGHESFVDNALLQLDRISGVIKGRVLVTVRPADRFDRTEVLAQLADDPRILQHGPGGLVYALLESVVEGHFETIGQLDDQIELIEDELFDDQRTTPQFQRRVYGLRKDLVHLRRAVLPMRELVNAMLRHAKPGVEHVDARYDDLYDQVLRAAEWTESLRDMITTVFETNISMQDARLNVVMKKLAGWAAIIAVPTAVTGWFGQNLPYPGFQSTAGLIQSIVLILVVSVGMFALMKHHDWI